MFLQEIPAETTGYMILGYVVIFGALSLYLASMYIRWQNLKKDQESLEGLEKQK